MLQEYQGIAITFSFLVSQVFSLQNAVHSWQTRRDALSSIAGAVTAVPITLPANAGQQDLYIPGVAGGAPFKNLIVDESSAKQSVEASWNPTKLVTNLGNSRIHAKELSPLNPSMTPFASDKELYYGKLLKRVHLGRIIMKLMHGNTSFLHADRFLFGAWQATATLRRKSFPYGTSYLPSSSLYEGSPRNRGEMPGDTTSYEIHYFSPNTDGSILNKSSKISADRVFNALSMNAAYDQLSQIEEVIWNYKKDPTRLTINFASLAKDMQPLGQKKAEIYLTARRSESTIDSDTGEPVFCASERLRSVVLVPGNVVVSDTENITEFQVIKGSNGNHVRAISRIAVYLTPNPNSREGILWQDVNGKAVAFFDYEIDLKRLLEVDPEGNENVCLWSPFGLKLCS